MKFKYLCRNSICNHEIIIQENELNIKQNHYITCDTCGDLMELIIYEDDENE